MGCLLRKCSPAQVKIMATTKLIFLSCLVGVLGFLAYRELQVVTVGFSFDPLFIPAKRSDVFRWLFDVPEFWVKVHPLCTGISNIVRSQDADGRRIIEFDIEEKAVLLGFYDTGHFTFHVAIKALKEDVSTQLKGQTGMVQINQGFDLTDVKDGKDGTMLGDHGEYTAPRFFARIALRQAEAAHSAITQNIKQHFVEMSKES